MTELKAKGPRTPHVAGTAPSPTQVGAPLRGRPDAGPFQAGEASGPTPTASGLPLSLDGLVFPRPCQAQDLDAHGVEHWRREEHFGQKWEQMASELTRRE